MYCEKQTFELLQLEQCMYSNITRLKKTIALVLLNNEWTAVHLQYMRYLPIFHLGNTIDNIIISAYTNNFHNNGMDFQSSS